MTEPPVPGRRHHRSPAASRHGPPRPACAGHRHPQWWDATVDGETPGQRQARHARALAVCGGCPAVAECAATVSPQRDDGVRAGRVLPRLPDGRRLGPYPDGSEAAVFFAALREARGAPDRYRAREYRRLRRAGLGHDQACEAADQATARWSREGAA